MQGSHFAEECGFNEEQCCPMTARAMPWTQYPVPTPAAI
jgi:hypothetical protein